MRWIFVARVTPERIPLSIGQPIEWEAATHDFEYKITATFVDSQVAADVTITKGNPDLLYLRNVVDLDLRGLIDAGAYAYGVRFDLDIISATEVESGKRCVFGINIPVLSDRKVRFVKENGISTDIIYAALNHTSMRMILADFREAMRFAVGTGFYCYRAIEAMKQHMKIDEDEKSQISWDRLREILNVDRSAIDYVKSHADLPRHGAPSSITDEERKKIFQITDEMIARFIEYLKNGEKSQLALLSYGRGTLVGLKHP